MSQMIHSFQMSLEGALLVYIVGAFFYYINIKRNNDDLIRNPIKKNRG